MILSTTGTGFGTTSGGFQYPVNEVLTSTVFHIYADGPHNSAGLVDVKGHYILRTGTGSVVSNDQKKFGSGSIWCPGNINSYYRISGKNFALGQGAETHNLNDFTLEMWVRPLVQARLYPTVLSNYIGTWTTNSWAICYNHQSDSQQNKFSFQSYVWAQANGGKALLEANVQSEPNTWHHVAIVRQNSTYYLVLNGTIVDSRAFSSAIDNPIGIDTFYYFCRADIASTAYQGYIDEIRLVRRAMYLNGEGAPTSAIPLFKLSV